jgi:hypothetical protein
MNTTLQLPTPASANLQTAAQAAEPTAELFDRYADSVVSCYAHLYDAVEVHGVRNYADGSDDATCYEIDNLTPASFSVYVHMKDGGLDCVGDFGRYGDAVKYGAEVSAMYGWPVRNFVLEQYRTSTLVQLQ